MEWQRAVVLSVILLAFHRRVVDSCCPTMNLTAGMYFSDAPVTYAAAETITVACNLSYIATGGSGSGTCVSTGSNKCSWSWGTANSVMLQCTRGCLAPTLTQGVAYVSGTSSTSYLSGTTVSLKCSTNYGLKVGSTTGTCNGTTFTWIWATGKQLECDPACPAPLLTTGIEFVSGNSSEYTLGDVITVRCSSGYTSTGGGASATCLSSNTWQWNGTAMLQCTRGCTAPTLTQGVVYVSGDTTTVYLKGSTINLKCSTNYGYKLGGYNGTCSDTFAWTWNTGKKLECDPACPAPTLSIGTEFAVGNSSEFTLNDTIALRCSSGYLSTGGGASAVCLSNNTWQWNGTGILKCTPTCVPPAAGINATVSSGFSKSIYLLNDTIQYECVSGYVPLIGSLTGLCTSVDQWTWQAGSTASLSCVIAPPYKDKSSDTFKPSTCESYVIRSAPTSSTCLISCLNDGYCRGYAFDGVACYLDRPFIETTVSSLMPCFARLSS